jgi:hypothetical protein
LPYRNTGKARRGKRKSTHIRRSEGVKFCCQCDRDIYPGEYYSRFRIEVKGVWTEVIYCNQCQDAHDYRIAFEEGEVE